MIIAQRVREVVMSYIKVTAALAFSVGLLWSVAQAQDVNVPNAPNAPNASARFTPIERPVGGVGVSCSSKDGEVDCYCTGGCKRTKHDCSCTGLTAGGVLSPARPE
jgi:hypothetical protein